MRKIDEFQNLYGWEAEIDIDEFYDAMDISEEQKEKRKDLADELFFFLANLFVLADITQDVVVCEWYLRSNLTDLVIKYGKYDSFTLQYIDKFTEEYIGSTFQEGEYWTSYDRALIGALNESNSILNYGELADAIEAGYTKKTWKAELDRKTRKDHRNMSGKTIDIEENFKFPDCEMMFPHDEVNGSPEQLVNCRCSLSFS